MLYETIVFEVKDGLATLTLNRPEVFNALNDQLAEEVADALGEAATDPSVRALLVTGAGKAFCAGQDLTALDHTRPLGRHLELTWNPIVARLSALEKPTVAALNGVAAGAGASLALACDLRVASERASLMFVFSKVGLVPDSGATWLLPRLVGPARALELAYLAEPVDAGRALSLGLVTKVVAPEAVMDEAETLARRLAAGPTLAYGLTKRAMDRAASMTFAEALDYEAMLQTVCGRSADYAEGVAAFTEKRPARFQGR